MWVQHTPRSLASTAFEGAEEDVPIFAGAVEASRTSSGSKVALALRWSSLAALVAVVFCAAYRLGTEEEQELRATPTASPFASLLGLLEEHDHHVHRHDDDDHQQVPPSPLGPLEEQDHHDHRHGDDHQPVPPPPPPPRPPRPPRPPSTHPQKPPEKLTVSGLCHDLHCTNGEYAFKGVLKSGRAWFAGGGRDEECFTEWIYYDPDPRRDGTMPAQWVFYGTQRAPWAKGDPKDKPEWDHKEYKETPEKDYKRHGYLVTPSKDVAPPETGSWQVKCNTEEGTWKEANISVARGTA